jgi:y4mF family transcriptional regulator
MGVKRSARAMTEPSDDSRMAPFRDDSVDQIGGFVRARRKAARLTQRELAELAGVGNRVVWELERGKSTMRMDVVNAVLEIFGRRLGVVAAPRPVEALR